jgi:hypothetical protein
MGITPMLGPETLEEAMRGAEVLIFKHSPT